MTNAPITTPGTATQPNSLPGVAAPQPSVNIAAMTPQQQQQYQAYQQQLRQQQQAQAVQPAPVAQQQALQLQQGLPAQPVQPQQAQPAAAPAQPVGVPQGQTQHIAHQGLNGGWQSDKDVNERRRMIAKM
jgi:hypothetical protein